MIPRVKGTQDFLDLTLFNFALSTIKKHLQLYCFTEISLPILEYVELFQRSLGEHTDVISKEMFLVASRTQDSEATICLRPEATAPIARTFVEHTIQTIPWKVFTWGPMFRYERPQKGRFRQFNQVSMEIIGSVSIAQDVQLIKMLDRLFHEKLLINDYALLINFLGCQEDRKNYEQKLRAFLDTISDKICSTCTERKTKNILRIFDCKNPVCQQLYEKAPKITDSLCPACQQEWADLQKQLDLLSISYKPQPRLVRGLDYYSKTVFEFVSGNLGAQNAFCAGGRYDQLIKQLGNKEDQPSIGAAIGVERLLLLLEIVKSTLPLEQAPTLHCILPLTPQQQTLALLLADTLQEYGLSTEVLLEGDSLKSMMRKANKMGAKFCLLLGEDEQQKNEVTIKNMVTSQEERLAQVDVVSYLKK